MKPIYLSDYHNGYVANHALGHIFMIAYLLHLASARFEHCMPWITYHHLCNI